MTESKPIDRFRVGDLILSRSENALDGPLALKTVEEVFVRLAKILNLHLPGHVIRTTAEHPFFVYDRGWLPAGSLHAGDLLASHDGQWVAVEDLLDTGEYETVYNLRVADFHTYFVGSEEWGFSVWAHNAEYGSNQARKAARGIELAATADDLVTKGMHIHVKGIELKVLPGNGGSVVFKPVFSSQANVAESAISRAQMALNDPTFLGQLQAGTGRAFDFVRHSNLPGASSKAGELRFLQIALGKLAG